MKAVLLNSADKVAGVHGSSRTIIAQGDETANDWRTTTAFNDSTISLDQQLGAGHLNARRALQQFESGEYTNGENAPLRGWDFGETGGTGSALLDYPLGGTLEAGTWVAVTLAWDRRVYIGGEINYEKTYDQFDFFTGYELENLNLYLLPADAMDLSGATQFNSSVSEDDNLEHIFFQVPATDEYKIVVHHAGGPGDDQFFGLAWWAGEIDAPIPGDFNGDGRVDGADLTQWKGDFGGPGSDADGDGDSDGADFLAWQQNLGFGVPATPASVPEPSAWMLLALGLPLLIRRRAA